MSSRAIVLFTGDPKREGLRKGVPAAVLTALHRQLIATIRTAGMQLIIASERGSRFSLVSSDTRAELRLDSLGRRIDASLRFAFGLGFQSVLLLAGDVAGVDRPLIDDAFAALGSGADRCVIGPSGDGGFYLLGVNRTGAVATAMAWDQVAWFGSSATSSLVAQAESLGAAVSFLRTLDDIDNLADARRITAQLSSSFERLRSRLLSHLATRPAGSPRFSVPPTWQPGTAWQLRGPPPA